MIKEVKAKKKTIVLRMDGYNIQRSHKIMQFFKNWCAAYRQTRVCIFNDFFPGHTHKKPHQHFKMLNICHIKTQKKHFKTLAQPRWKEQNVREYNKIECSNSYPSGYSIVVLPCWIISNIASTCHIGNASTWCWCWW